MSGPPTGALGPWGTACPGPCRRLDAPRLGKARAIPAARSWGGRSCAVIYIPAAAGETSTLQGRRQEAGRCGFLANTVPFGFKMGWNKINLCKVNNAVAFGRFALLCNPTSVWSKTFQDPERRPSHGVGALHTAPPGAPAATRLLSVSVDLVRDRNISPTGNHTLCVGPFMTPASYSAPWPQGSPLLKLESGVPSSSQPGSSPWQGRAAPAFHPSAEGRLGGFLRW